jgi:ElaB/YqjD/DUF883 family membrane-anchored ribosome-binding protein
MDTEESGEMIKQQMQDTRSSLADKLETLEQQVVDTVQTATNAVSETMESVKDVVHDTVESVQNTVTTVKDSFDISAHVDRHPWAMLAGSVALGYLGGYLLPRSARAPANNRLPDRSATERNGHHESFEKPAGEPVGNYQTRENNHRSAEKPAAEPALEPSRFSEVVAMFGPEIGKLKGLAIGTLVGLVRDVVAQAVPAQLGAQLVDVLNSVTTKIGGEVIRGPEARSTPRGRDATDAPEMGGLRSSPLTQAEGF